MTLTLRRATPEDGAALARIFHDAIMRGAAAAYSLSQRRAWAGPAPDPARWAARAADAALWLAVCDGDPVGIVAMDDRVLDLLFVHPDHARQGIASVLLDHAEAQARCAGHREITSFVSDVARPVLARRGWVAQARNQIERRGVVLENTRMTLALS